MKLWERNCAARVSDSTREKCRIESVQKWMDALSRSEPAESDSDRNLSVDGHEMDTLDVNYLNELLEQDAEIREVRRLQMSPKNLWPTAP